MRLRFAIGACPGRHGKPFGVLCLVLLVAGCGVVSITVGTRAIPLSGIVQSLIAYDPSNDLHVIVWALRLPRAVLAVLAGACLGIAGGMMQAVTRNPLAEPGLLGINAGATVAVLLGVILFGLTRIDQYLWFGIAGAGVAGVAVFLLGRGHDAGVDPVRLILAGAGLSVMLGALSGLLLINAPANVYDDFRQWGAGSVEGRGGAVLIALSLSLVLGSAVAMAIAPALNALSMGSDVGRALGARPVLTWSLACLSIMLLAGGATAAVGPIGFIGLVAPHIARLFSGPDYRWILPYSALIAALLLQLADILGRLLVSPAEVAAGIVATVIGGPFFVAAVRRFKMVQL
jgi:ABC-type Fe3+-siderophore transport system, permease component